jgi:hypothetical protein
MSEQRERSVQGDAPRSPVTGPDAARSAAAPSQVSLHVERLVLHGLPLHARDGVRVRQAFEREMVRLLEDRPLDSQRLGAGALDELRPMSMTVGDGRDAERVGRELARVLQREWVR